MPQLKTSEKTYSLTAEEIAFIYDSGVDQGQSEALYYEKVYWPKPPERYDDLFLVLTACNILMEVNEVDRREGFRKFLSFAYKGLKPIC